MIYTDIFADKDPQDFTALDRLMIAEGANDGQPYIFEEPNPARKWFTPWRSRWMATTRHWFDPRISYAERCAKNRDRIIDALSTKNPLFEYLSKGQ